MAIKLLPMMVLLMTGIRWVTSMMMTMTMMRLVGDLCDVMIILLMRWVTLMMMLMTMTMMGWPR